jgi:hypothetical protein
MCVIIPAWESFSTIFFFRAGTEMLMGWNGWMGEVVSASTQMKIIQE